MLNRAKKVTIEDQILGYCNVKKLAAHLSPTCSIVLKHNSWVLPMGWNIPLPKAKSLSKSSLPDGRVPPASSTDDPLRVFEHHCSSAVPPVVALRLEPALPLHLLVLGNGASNPGSTLVVSPFMHHAG